MRNIILLSSAFIIILILVLNQSPPKNTEIVITIANLTQEDINIHLRNEFKKHANIEYVDGSISTKTIVLKVNDGKYNQLFLENLLNKWGCIATDFDFNNIAAYSGIE